MRLLLAGLFGALGHAATSSYYENAGVLDYVNPKIGTYGITPDGNGGMIPSTAPPFAKTRWTPQTRENFISQVAYNEQDGFIHGFQATHQPAIWMGENGHVVLVPGLGDVKPLFTDRAHAFAKADEKSTPYVYEVTMDAANTVADQNLTESIYSPCPGGAGTVPGLVRLGANGRTRRSLSHAQEAVLVYESRRQSSGQGQNQSISGSITTAMTATSHVGYLRFDFPNTKPLSLRYQQSRAVAESPYVFLQATRQNWTGSLTIDCKAQEVYGSNPQRQDFTLGPFRAPNFQMFFVSRFSQKFDSYGVTHGGNITQGAKSGNGTHLGAYVRFPQGTQRVEVRTGISFVSIDQARRNLDLGIPDGTSFDATVEALKTAWLEKIGRVQVEGVNKTDADYDQRTIFYTSLFHALQYPSEYGEPLTSDPDGAKTFYEGYGDRVHEATNDSYYQSWSIWDTFRAEHSTISLLAPERVNPMMRTLLNIYDWSGRLPLWANVIETNIMIATFVDAILANALARGFTGFDISKAWSAVKKNAFEPPENDTQLLYFDRETFTPLEVRAGLTAYMANGWVANDWWSESAARTTAYSFVDHAAAVVARHAGDNATAQALLKRSQNYRNIYNNATGFMEARNWNGTWAGPDQGWTEGDDWIYTFDVMHDPPGLADLMGGPEQMKNKLDAYFDGGHNDQSNEPSHHAPYLYAAIGYPASTQNLTRAIAAANYNAMAAGLSGNEDLGQMSSWYVFSAMGFYPLNPASDEYVVAAPFFERISLRLPAGAATGGVGGSEHNVTIVAPGAPTRPFVKSLKVDGRMLSAPVLKHGQLVTASLIEFEMADSPQAWGMTSA